MRPVPLLPVGREGDRAAFFARGLLLKSRGLLRKKPPALNPFLPLGVRQKLLKPIGKLGRQPGQRFLAHQSNAD